MKRILYASLFLLSSSSFAQNTWNQRLPLKNLSPFPYTDVVYENGRILQCATTGILEMDERGTIRGFVSSPITAPISNFIRRKIDTNSGEIYFLTGLRVPFTSPDYTLRFYKPGFGVTAEIVLPDSSSAFSSKSPAILELDDSTLVVFGRKYAYKVRASDGNSFSMLWQKSLSFLGIGAGKAAVQTNDDFVVFSLDGQIIGLNSDGEPTFSKSQAFNFYSAVALPDGIITCGTNADQKAVLVKLTYAGDLIWSNEYDDKWYHHLAPTTDGGFVATGSSSTGKIALLKTDGNGLKLWSKEYQAGTGAKVLAIPDGGYYISALTSIESAYFGIKTNALGVTSLPKNEFFVQNRQLKTEGLKASFEPNASLFNNGTDGTLISPADSQAVSLFAFAPWIGGFDADGLLHVAADDYSSVGGADFKSGVMNGSPGDFNRVWLATKTEIETLRRDFLLDQVLDLEIPYDLLSWPAKGNIHNQYNIDFTKIKTNPDLQWAPFVDLNGDGLYNVYDGDYPQIKGDQMAWWALNDDSTHFNSNGRPLKIDMGIAAYVFECPQNEVVKNSVFVDFEIINRSGHSYDSTYIGFYTDFDLGCPYDDYLGCMPDANSYYVYNKDVEDNPDCFGVPGFGLNIPVQSVAFLNRTLDHFLYGDNLGVPPYHPVINPSAPTEFYNYLKGYSSNGTPPTLGGSGYNPGSTNYTDYVFFSDPSEPLDWSMCNENLPTYDQKGFGSHGPFLYSSGDTFSISLAFTTHHNVFNPCPFLFWTVKPAIQQLTSWANSGTLEAAPNLGLVQEILGNPISLGTEIPGAMFQWSTGATSPTIMVSQPGEYSVTMTSEAGCQSVETVLVKMGAETKSPNSVLNWALYPNPAMDNIQVSCPDCLHGAPFLVILRNAQGALLRQENEARGMFSMNLQGLPSGFYWLELWQAGAFLGSRKFSHVQR